MLDLFFKQQTARDWLGQEAKTQAVHLRGNFQLHCWYRQNVLPKQQPNCARISAASAIGENATSMPVPFACQTPPCAPAAPADAPRVDSLKPNAETARRPDKAEAADVLVFDLPY
jgi:hypothetical protein